MRRFLWSKVLIVALLMAFGCGTSEEPSENAGAVEPPANPQRALPTAGGPEDDDFEEPPPAEQYERDDFVSGGAHGECCAVTFAFAPSIPEEVQDIRLRGTLFPLNGEEGLALEENDGIWSQEACLGPHQFGTYYYELSLLSPFGDESFLRTAHNPYAPTTAVAGELVNGWFPGEDCESLDLAVHGQTSE